MDVPIVRPSTGCHGGGQLVQRAPRTSLPGRCPLGRTLPGSSVGPSDGPVADPDAVPNRTAAATQRSARHAGSSSTASRVPVVPSSSSAFNGPGAEVGPWFIFTSTRPRCARVVAGGPASRLGRTTAAWSLGDVAEGNWPGAASQAATRAWSVPCRASGLLPEEPAVAATRAPLTTDSKNIRRQSIQHNQAGVAVRRCTEGCRNRSTRRTSPGGCSSAAPLCRRPSAPRQPWRCRGVRQQFNNPVAFQGLRAATQVHGLEPAGGGSWMAKRSCLRSIRSTEQYDGWMPGA